VIDLGAMQQEAAFIGKMLKKLGLPTSLGDAIAHLARTIRDHKHLERIITEAEPSERQMLYDTIKPNLRFQPWPLDKYIASAGQMAEREQLPILGEDGKLHPFQPASDVKTLEKHAEDVLARSLAKRTLTLVCHKCLEEGQFHQLGEETRVSVIIRARKAGWKYDPLRETETCPKCAI
jgi:hypothetical protein